MSPRRLRALVRRVTEEIRRDRPSLALLFIAPILITGLVTFIVRESGAPDIHVAIVAGSGGPAPRFVQALESGLESAGVGITTVPDEATARADVSAGTASLAILFPASVGAGPITVLSNGLDPAGEAAQIAVIQKALIGAVASAAGATLPTVVHEAVYGVPSTDQITAFAPAIVGFFAYFFVYVLTGVSFLRERTGGTLERLLATPVTRAEIVTGYTLGFGLFATVQVALLLAWSLGTINIPAIGPAPAFAIGLGIHVAGSPLLAFLVVLLLAVGAVSLGIFLSTFARTELQIIQFIPIVLVPQFLLSGVLFPTSTLPAVLKPLVALMPLGYAVDGLRQVFIRGADLSAGALQGDLAILALVAVFFAVIASLTIRQEVV